MKKKRKIIKMRKKKLTCDMPVSQSLTPEKRESIDLWLDSIDLSKYKLDINSMIIISELASSEK